MSPLWIMSLIPARIMVYSIDWINI